MDFSPCIFTWIMPWSLWSQLVISHSFTVIYYVQCAVNEKYCHTNQLDWLNLSSPKIPLPHRSYSSAALSKRSPKRSSAQLDKEVFHSYYNYYYIVITSFVTAVTKTVSLLWYSSWFNCDDIYREKLITQTQLPEILRLFMCFFLAGTKQL